MSSYLQRALRRFAVAAPVLAVAAGGWGVVKHLFGPRPHAVGILAHATPAWQPR